MADGGFPIGTGAVPTTDVALALSAATSNAGISVSGVDVASRMGGGEVSLDKRGYFPPFQAASGPAPAVPAPMTAPAGGQDRQVPGSGGIEGPVLDPRLVARRADEVQAPPQPGYGPPSVGQLTPVMATVGGHELSPVQTLRFPPNLSSPEEGHGPVAKGAGGGLSPDGEHLRQTWAYSFTLGLLCVIGPPTILSMSIVDDDVRYWINNLGSFAVFVPIWVVLLHFAQLKALKNGRPVPKFFFVAAAVLPAIFFTTSGGIYYSQAKGTAKKLSVYECKADSQSLHKAYIEARDLWYGCVGDEINKNNNLPIMVLPSVQTCPNFKALMAADFRNWQGYGSSSGGFGKILPANTWAREWDYLALTEQTHQCAGWCAIPGAAFEPMLWTSAGTLAAGCQNFVAHKMLVVQQKGWIIMWLGLLTMFLSMPCYFVLRKTLTRLGHH